MKHLAVLLLALSFSPSALASWYYNADGGIGANQPDGWTVEHNGRSSRLLSPGEDSEQSSIFFGSDWEDHVDTLAALKIRVEKEEGTPATPIHFSDLDGFRSGSADQGAIYLLREKENVIVIEYEIRGDKNARDEARSVLDSIDVRTGGYDNRDLN